MKNSFLEQWSAYYLCGLMYNNSADENITTMNKKVDVSTINDEDDQGLEEAEIGHR
ncbi:hypothetical protein KHA80_06095 [Anaerobacillus sp. HL2]|nr:hypothetical protein KHA80_06095 [Anaerobacillus sp. HL2]